MVDVLRPVVDTLLSPPLQLLREFPQPGALTGTGNLPDIVWPNIHPSWGAVFIASVPIYLSRTASPRPIFKRPLLQLTFLEQTFGPSPSLPVRTELVFQDYAVVRWSNIGLDAIEYYVLPGVSIQFSYLRFG